METNDYYYRPKKRSLPWNIENIVMIITFTNESNFGIR